MADPIALPGRNIVQPCHAHSSRTGKPCRLPAINGGTVCVTHGGRAPQVKRAAEERLRAMQPQAVQVVEDLMEPENPPFVRLAAAKEVFDRTGVGKDKQAGQGVVVFTLRIDRGGSDSPDA